MFDVQSVLALGRRLNQRHQSDLKTVVTGLRTGGVASLKVQQTEARSTELRGAPDIGDHARTDGGT